MKTVTVKDTYIMNTIQEGLSVFNLHDVQKGEYVGIYMGEIVGVDRLDRYRSGRTERTHFFSLSKYGGTFLSVDGSLHGRYDLKYFVKNGVGSFLNSGTGPLANCTIEVIPNTINTAGGRSYVLLEEGQPIPGREIPLWILLKAKSFIPARTQLRWDYRVDPLGDDSDGMDNDDSEDFRISQPTPSQ